MIHSIVFVIIYIKVYECLQIGVDMQIQGLHVCLLACIYLKLLQCWCTDEGSLKYWFVQINVAIFNISD